MTRAQALTVLRELERLVDKFEGAVEMDSEPDQYKVLDALEHYCDVVCLDMDETKKRTK